MATFVKSIFPFTKVESVTKSPIPTVDLSESRTVIDVLDAIEVTRADIEARTARKGGTE